ncbi:acetyltransferase [uncultured Thalassospira sp.]|uniref:acetyltransferase n=1 Tax=uncultured Thalassospira sp. TaxID=404382 RepID=UPI0025850218|nr:acetyltransferase [uncultured Thalassospira sp.]
MRTDSGLGAKKQYVIVGAGGHACVVLSALLAMNSPEIAGCIAPSSGVSSSLDLKILGDDQWLMEQNPEQFLLFNGIGCVDVSNLRSDIFRQYRKFGFKFGTIVHPRAIVADDVRIAMGSQIMAGAVLQTGSQVGQNVIVNTGVIIDHDCVIGDHAHIAPGAVLCGAVRIGESSLIGAGSTIVQNTVIAENVLVGAGSTVTRAVAAGARIAGSPAKTLIVK